MQYLWYTSIEFFWEICIQNSSVGNKSSKLPFI